MACNDIGQFYESRGDLPAALKYYLRNRDYSHPAKYEMEFILNILRVKINIPHLNQIDSFAAKGQKNPMLEHSGCGNSKVRRGLAARMKVCCGLAALGTIRIHRTGVHLCLLAAQCDVNCQLAASTKWRHESLWRWSPSYSTRTRCRALSGPSMCYCLETLLFLVGCALWPHLIAMS